MDKHILSCRFILRRLVCVTVYSSDCGAVLKFYIRHDLLLTHSGSCSVWLIESLGEIKLKGEEFRPRKPRRFYDVTVEEAGSGDGRDG